MSDTPNLADAAATDRDATLHAQGFDDLDLSKDRTRRP